MEVKQGYKQTEVGVIPSDWQVYELNDVLQRIADVDHYMPKTENFGYPYVMTGDLKERVSDIDFASCKKISLEYYSKLSKKIKNVKGDILLARYATVGTVSYVDIQCEFIVSYSCVTIKPNTSKVLGMYLFNYFKSHIFKNEVRNKVNANIQDNVGIGDLLKMQIPLPLLPEQTAIANALLDMDALISQTEKLIEKKKAIKQGAMQELLKPKEGWVTKKLGDLVSVIKSGGTPLTSIKEYYNGEIPFLSISDMTSQGKYLSTTSSKISQNGLDNSSSWLVQNGSLIYSMYASVGFVSLNKIDIAISQAVLGMKFKDFMNLNFMYYTLLSMQKSVLKFVGEGTQKNLNAASVKQFDIKYPSTFEQESIADILSNMDSDIDLQIKKLKKLKQQKQGMMQALLTGKIRLL